MEPGAAGVVEIALQLFLVGKPDRMHQDVNLAKVRPGFFGHRSISLNNNMLFDWMFLNKACGNTHSKSELEYYPTFTASNRGQFLHVRCLPILHHSLT